ncbi:hypothetical protein LJC42_05630 [Eubacteriales bacterium OttesenSCG-928-K08]|nr:hypothetical protein [Eubacteriales bacterium OttesenSCG-928-K08]
MSKKQNHVPERKRPARIVVERHYIGNQNIGEAFLPVIYEELLKRIDRRTFEERQDTA